MKKKGVTTATFLPSKSFLSLKRQRKLKSFPVVCGGSEDFMEVDSIYSLDKEGDWYSVSYDGRKAVIEGLKNPAYGTGYRATLMRGHSISEAQLLFSKFEIKSWLLSNKLWF